MIVAKDFYLLRTPLLPLNVLEQFNGLPHAQLNERLKAIFNNRFLQEAIYIASPELYQEFEKWQEGKITDGRDLNKLLFSLFRYLLRMSARCTPYGLFAGCALGAITENTGISLAGPAAHKKHCRLDMNYVAELSSSISLLPEVQEQLRYFPNNSLYKIAGKYRYAEFSVKNKFRHYHLSAVDCSDYLEAILCKAAAGATLHNLAQCIVSSEISTEEARHFVTELLQNQLLVSELEPTITGEEFFTRLIKKLDTLQHTAHITEKLLHINELLNQPSGGIESYLQTNAVVKELLPDTHLKDLVQTDLFMATRQNTISALAITEVQRHATKLWSLSRLTSIADLDDFRQAFLERYDQQEVPLVLALDAETGIGYGSAGAGQADHSPLVDDIIAGKREDPKTIAWSKLHDFQLKKLNDCLRENKSEIEITDKDLEDLKEPGTLTIPDSFHVIGTILAKTTADIDAGNFQFEWHHCGGPSVGTLMGRFCHGDHMLAAKVKACLLEEEQCNPDQIYAEVIHLPEARTGNVLLRPELRKHEIVYLGKGSVELERQIPLTDLLISISDDRIVLRSKKFNKTIIPRLSTAHNFGTGLPAYKFICDLQYQQIHGTAGWRWTIGNEEPFLPRVRYGKVILCKSTWILHKKDYPELNGKAISGDTNVDVYMTFYEHITKLNGLPSHLQIVEGDNALPINLRSESCVRILADTLIKKERVELQERLATTDNCFVQGPGGVHTNEIIIPFKTIPKTAVTNSTNRREMYLPKQETVILTRQVTQDPQTNFIIGSQWLYAKIYCGTSSGERILKEVVNPLTEKLLNDKIIDKWFFMRYADPQHHLRLRFHNCHNSGFWKTVLERLYSAMELSIENCLAYKIQLDTYQRETRRYGARTIEITEDIFYYDSQAVINYIALLDGEEGEQYRWLLATRGLDMLLGDFDYDTGSKLTLVKKLQQGFFAEFGGDKRLSDQLNNKYREYMRLVSSFLDPSRDEENQVTEAVQLFASRSYLLRQAADKIRALRVFDNTILPFDELVPSYIHLFLNRILLCNQRKHELVIYHFLSKYYESQLAIRKIQLQKV
ncbi:MAG: lantibiotic dehydratase [Chitinophagaceae bacterium]